jgi:tRNA(adenine34) deaminase
MKQAMREAERAFDKGEVPVGAVVVCQNRIIAKAHNQTELLNDVTAHAEILAITAAANHLGSKYLQDCTMYVTLEPCVMCAGALFWAQLDRLVFAAHDDKRGFSLYGYHLLHPKCYVESGIMREESMQLLKSFFNSKR